MQCLLSKNSCRVFSFMATHVSSRETPCLVKSLSVFSTISSSLSFISSSKSMADVAFPGTLGYLFRNNLSELLSKYSMASGLISRASTAKFHASSSFLKKIKQLKISFGFRGKTSFASMITPSVPSWPIKRSIRSIFSFA